MFSDYWLSEIRTHFSVWLKRQIQEAVKDKEMEPKV